MSKLAAGREKDKTFVNALILNGMLDVKTLHERNELISNDHQFRKDRSRSHLNHSEKAARGQA